jgi:hypothetical protein
MNRKEKVVADLTGYASLLGESFASKINLLSQIIKHAHYLSVGRYKERLLSKTISEFVPKRFEVGTGFVLFPTEPDPGSVNNPDFDPLNMGAHILSKQCDVIVYDSSAFPVVFRDEEFVVVRPESVRSVIEVKGAISPTEVNSVLESFLDFGNKWRECQLFYKSHHQDVVKRPSLYALGWDIYKNKSGRKVTNGKKIRKQVNDFYKANLKKEQLMGFPVLDKLLVYNDSEILRCVWSDKVDEKFVSKEGFYTVDGRFTRFDSNGNAYRGGDRTIASLLASIHYSLGRNFNRFFSYTDETRSPGNHIPYEYHGFDFFIEDDDEAIKLLNTDIS